MIFQRVIQGKSLLIGRELGQIESRDVILVW